MLSAMIGTGPGLRRSGASKPSSASAGFTLIEMLVAMVIFGSVLAVAGSLLIRTMGNESQGRSADTALRQVNEAGQILANDLHAAMAPARASIDANGLRAIFRGQAPDRGFRTDYFDIVLASPTQLRFRANVLPELDGSVARTECVDWLSVTGGIKRVVYWDWRTCSSPLAEERWVLRGVGTAPQPVFGYRMLTPVPATPGSCQTTLVTGQPPGDPDSQDLRLARVVAVLADFSTLVAGSGGRIGSMDARSTVGLRSHTSRDYRYALGCSY